MQKGNVELLAAKEREQNSEQTNVETLCDYWLTRVELERSLGGKLGMPSPPMSRQPQTESLEHDRHE
jgi:hypothetical protein